MKKKGPAINLPIELANEVQDELINELQTNPIYSLEPDPLGELGFTKEKILFVKNYLNYRDIVTAANMSNIEIGKARDYLNDAQVKHEIRRINLVLNKRKFAKRLLSMDEIGGYLTSLLIDDDVFEHEKLSNKEKIEVTKLIIALNKEKIVSLQNPNPYLDATIIENDIKDLSATELKNLITKIQITNKSSVSETELVERRKIINELNKDNNFDPSELAYLETLSLKELTDLINLKNNTEGEIKNEKNQQESSD